MFFRHQHHKCYYTDFRHKSQELFAIFTFLVHKVSYNTHNRKESQEQF
nr:MAG TPA: hypothetical protein [Bacteriophage sp.]